MLVRTTDISLLWQEVRFLLTYPKKLLCVNHCSKIIIGRTPACFTYQHLAAFDQKCPRTMNLFYDLFVDFKPFPWILFSPSSNTGDQLFLAACSVSIIPFLTNFRWKIFSWLSVIDEKRKFMFQFKVKILPNFCLSCHKKFVVSKRMTECLTQSCLSVGRLQTLLKRNKLRFSSGHHIVPRCYLQKNPADSQTKTHFHWLNDSMKW